MKLTELFDKKLEITQEFTTFEKIAKTRLDNGDVVEVYLEPYETYFTHIPIYNLVFTVNEKIDITNQGNSIAIFSAVVSLLAYMSARLNLHTLTFSASDNRHGLYTRLLKKFGYKVYSTGDYFIASKYDIKVNHGEDDKVEVYVNDKLVIIDNIRPEASPESVIAEFIESVTWARNFKKV